jgi:hypothetical protein
MRSGFARSARAPALTDSPVTGPSLILVDSALPDGGVARPRLLLIDPTNR